MKSSIFFSTLLLVVGLVNVAFGQCVVSGASTVCVSGTTTLSSSISSGTEYWSVSSPRATVSATGVVTGLLAGPVIITYHEGGLSPVFCTRNMTVQNALSPGITGATDVCVGSDIVLAGSPVGGAWSSTYGNATAAAGGIITGVAAGTEIISYSVTNSCGTYVATTTITVNALPTVGSISGTSPFCVSSSPITFSCSPSGGAWSSSHPPVADVDAAGDVTGYAAGTTTISYSVTDAFGCTASAVFPLTIDDVVSPAITASVANICLGGTTTFAGFPAGGTWYSSTGTTHVTIGASTGILTGTGLGSTVIYYEITNSCPGSPFSDNSSLDVDPAPTVGTISGSSPLCTTSPSPTFTCTPPGGVWSSSDIAVASVSTGGVVDAIVAGTADISYTITNVFGCTDFDVYTVTVDEPAAATTGLSEVCVGATIGLSNTTPGGTWSSGNVSIATVDASTGVVTGVSAGNVQIFYNGTNGCGAFAVPKIIVVESPLSAGTITGATSVCAGATTSLGLTLASPGGVWTCVDPPIATVGSSNGVVTGVAGFLVTTITYTVSNSCGTFFATHGMTVDPLPYPGTISGPSAICALSSAPLSSSVGGGTWSSSAVGIATVDPASGLLTGVLPGGCVISYTLTNLCGSSSATHTVTVNGPDATISGPYEVCVGSTITLAGATLGGTWASSNISEAGVNIVSGVVSGVSAGMPDITYTVTDGFGCTLSSVRTLTVTVIPTVAPITGTLAVCTGAISPLSSTTPGGVWSSSNVLIAGIGVSGFLQGVSAGTADISYAVTAGLGCVGYAIATSTVYPVPDATISGTTTICLSTTTTLAGATAGGTWTSSDPSIVSVGVSSGIATGVSGGAATISYSVTNSFGCTSLGTAAFTVDITPSAGTISGSTLVCPGSTTTLTASGHAGGVWSSSATGVMTIGVSDGVVGGVAPGSATMTYSITNTCGSSSATHVMHIGQPAPSISGPSDICENSSFVSWHSITLTASVAGGTWSTSNSSIASVLGFNTTQAWVYGVSDGVATITYTYTTSCGTSAGIHTVTVNPAPNMGTINATTSFTVPVSASASTPYHFYASGHTTGTYLWTHYGGSALNVFSPDYNDDIYVSSNSGYSNAHLYFIITTPLGCTEFTYITITIVP